MTETRDRCRLILCWTVLASFAAALALPPLVGIRLDYASFGAVLALATVLAIAWPCAVWRRMTGIQTGIEASIAAILLSIPLLVVTYVAMRAGMPLADARLAAMDDAIGFSAPAFVRLVDRSATLSAALGYCYSSFSFQLILLPMLLCCLGDCRRGYGMMFGFIAIGAMASLICVFFPAVGSFAYFGIERGDLANINGMFGYHFLASFEAVRNDALYTLSLNSASGIVTFPSVHAAVAVLCGWAAWQSRALRWAFFVLNLGMFVSALTHGAHYLVDLIAGAAVAWLAIMLVRRVFLRQPPDGAPTRLTPARAVPATAA